MCEYIGHDFGAYYPDSCCIDGFLWDMDSGYDTDDGWVYTHGGEEPCPQCNPVDIREIIQDHLQVNQMAIEDDFMQCPECGVWLHDDYGSVAPPICPHCDLLN